MSRFIPSVETLGYSHVVPTGHVTLLHHCGKLFLTKSTCRSSAWILVFALFSVRGPAEQPPEVPPADSARAGQSDRERQHHREIVAYLQESVKAQPDRVEWRCALAVALEAAGENAQAEAEYRVVLRHDPAHCNAAWRLSEMREAAGDWEGVADVLARCVEPCRDRDLYDRLVRAYQQLGRFSEAARYGEQACALPGAGADEQDRLADVYTALGKHALAASALRKALRFAPTDPALHFKLGRAYCQTGNYLGDLADCQLPGAKAGKIRAGVFVMDTIEPARQLFRVAPEASAIYHLMWAREFGMDTPELTLLIADAWFAAQRYGQSAHIYEQVAQRSPDVLDGPHWRRLAKCALEQKRYDEFISYTERAQKTDRSESVAELVEAHVRVADAYGEQGQLAGYIRHLVATLGYSSDNADLHFRLGNAYWEQGEREKATAEWQITLELQPDHPAQSIIKSHLRQRR